MLHLTVRKSPILIALTLVAVTAAPGSFGLLSEEAEAEANATVTVFNFDYRDADSGTQVSTVNAGNSVTFIWTSGTHSVTHGVQPVADGVVGSPVAGDFNSGLRDTPTSAFVVTFPDTGVFNYYCTVHTAMRGVVVVL